MRSSCLLLLVLATALAPACAVNPVSGESEIILMSEEKEQEIGDEGARQVEAQLGLIENDALEAYVGELGRKLALHSPRQDVEYSFHIVEMEEPNAFALPGGYIYVSRGLLALANTEAELAGVIAHEIGHVAARHSAQRDTQVKVASLLTLLGMVAAATAGDGAAVAATQYLGQGFIAAYSREQERQSDRIAMELAAGSGIDPAGLASFLRSLDNTTRLKEGASRAPGFFDSHPATPERLAEATTRAQVLRWKPDVAAGSDALLSEARAREVFIARLDGLVVGPAAREGILRENHLLHGDLDFALRFPHGWTVHNARSHVIALSPGRDAIALLELQGPGDDPRAAAAVHAREEGLFLSDAAPIRIGYLPAFRARAKARTPAGVVDSVITWIAYRGQIYRLAAGSAPGSFPKYEGIFRSFARGFRPLRAEDLADITELRLRIAEAREGETLAELSERTGNEWDVNETAVHNRLFSSDRLRAGQLVKIARSERYAPTKEEPAEPSPVGPVQGPRQTER